MEVAEVVEGDKELGDADLEGLGDDEGVADEATEDWVGEVGGVEGGVVGGAGEGGGGEGEVGGEGDTAALVVGGDAGAGGEVGAEEEEAGVGGGVGGVGEVAVVGEAEEGGGWVADLGEGEGAMMGDGADEGAPCVALLGTDT